MKAILETAVREWAWDQVERVAVDDVRVVAELQQKGGVTFVSWSEDELRKLRGLAQATWDDWAKKSPIAKRAVESQKAWVKDLGLVG